MIILPHRWKHHARIQKPRLDNNFAALYSITKQHKKIEVKNRLDSRDTSKQYDRSIEGMIPKVWSKLPQDLLQKQGTDTWQFLTKNCQRFLTGKPLVNSKVLNNELNVKLDFNAISKELKSSGVVFNKSLSTLKKKM